MLCESEFEYIKSEMASVYKHKLRSYLMVVLIVTKKRN